MPKKSSEIKSSDRNVVQNVTPVLSVELCDENR